VHAAARSSCLHTLFKKGMNVLIHSHEVPLNWIRCSAEVCVWCVLRASQPTQPETCVLWPQKHGKMDCSPVPLPGNPRLCVHAHTHSLVLKWTHMRPVESPSIGTATLGRCTNQQDGACQLIRHEPDMSWQHTHGMAIIIKGTFGDTPAARPRETARRGPRQEFVFSHT
jgi:hypothetical protein